MYKFIYRIMRPNKYVGSESDKQLYGSQAHIGSTKFGAPLVNSFRVSLLLRFSGDEALEVGIHGDWRPEEEQRAVQEGGMRHPSLPH